MKTFWKRTLSATVYAVLFLGSIYSAQLSGNRTFGLCLFGAFLLFVTVGCTFEFFRIVAKQGAHPTRGVGYVLAVASFVATYIVTFLLFSNDLAVFIGGPMRLVQVALLALLIFPIVVMLQLWSGSEQPFRDAAYTILPALYVGVPLGLMPALHFHANILVMILAMVWINDSAAYMCGSWYGKHKMWPRHSPGKTWEGTVSGVIVTMVFAALVGPLFNDSMSWCIWAVVGALTGVVSTLGDLTESMLKRSVDVKDSGKIMPGHGGFLDRFDSLLMVTPVIFVFYVVFISI
ncbi:MAG: phosphatidate cytidylyltransferase [Bacteroidales bacterium]|nr:phosphatidate cytidylyltransferase [Bacteroidales bacterium]